MRRRLLDSRSHRDGWFNVKDDVGGLIDFEFIIQYLVLGNAHAAADGYRTLRRMQHRLRLNGEQAVLPEGEIESSKNCGWRSSDGPPDDLRPLFAVGIFSKDK